MLIVQSDLLPVPGTVNSNVVFHFAFCKEFWDTRSRLWHLQGRSAATTCDHHAMHLRCSSQHQQIPCLTRCMPLALPIFDHKPTRHVGCFRLTGTSYASTMLAPTRVATRGYNRPDTLSAPVLCRLSRFMRMTKKPRKRHSSVVTYVAAGATYQQPCNRSPSVTSLK